MKIASIQIRLAVLVMALPACKKDDKGPATTAGASEPEAAKKVELPGESQSAESAVPACDLTGRFTVELAWKKNDCSAQPWSERPLIFDVVRRGGESFVATFGPGVMPVDATPYYDELIVESASPKADGCKLALKASQAPSHGEWAVLSLELAIEDRRITGTGTYQQTNHQDPDAEETCTTALQAAGQVSAADGGEGTVEAVAETVDWVIDGRRVGALRIGMKGQDVLAIAGATRKEPACPCAYSVDLPTGLEVGVSDEDETVCEISITAAGPKTKDGIGVGSTFGEFERRYGAAEIEAATGDITFERAELVVSFAGETDRPEKGDKAVRMRLGGCGE